MDYNVKPMIHRFRQNGMNIVMDVNSGIVHVVDDVTYKVLEFYNGKIGTWSWPICLLPMMRKN